MANGVDGLTAPRILGRYAIYDAIASGGMATVHYGRLLGPVGFSRTVAIKRLHPQFAQDPQFVTMFLDEARLAGRIRHPNVVATLDVVASASEIFLVMDYVHGEALSRIIRELSSRDELVPLPVALRIATDTLQGLHAAHDARDERGVPLNIVHRDVSPQNILLGVDGIARLVDFGVAKASGQGATTREGHIKGKLGYMSPEQLRGQKLTRQSDIHAAAIVLWELLTGRRLFAGATEADTIAKVVKHEVPAASNFVKNLNPQVDAVIRRGLTEHLEDRFSTAREMCIALEACGEIASTMQVADWVQSQVRELLEQRTRVVSAIESSQHDRLAPAADPTRISSVDEDEAPKSRKEWVERLQSSPEIGTPAPSRRGPTSVPTPFTPPVQVRIGAAADVVPAVPATAPTSTRTNDSAKAARPSLHWYTIVGIVAGLAGIGFVVLSLTGRSTPAPLASAGQPTPSASVVAAAAAVPSVPMVPDRGLIAAATADLPAPMASAPLPVASAATASPRPMQTPVVGAGAGQKAKSAKPKGDIFDTRE